MNKQQQNAKEPIIISRYDTAMQETASIYGNNHIYSNRSYFQDNIDAFTIVLDEQETLITIFENKEDHYSPVLFSEWERRNDLQSSAIRNHFQLYPSDKPIRAELTQNCLTIHEDVSSLLPIILSEFSHVFPSTVIETDSLPAGVYARFNWPSS